MNDDLERLRAALKAAPPVTDPAAEARALHAAMESFDRVQETGRQPRPKSDRPARAGFLTGVRRMLSTLPTRPALTATVSVTALCVGVIIALPFLQRAPLTPNSPPPSALDPGQIAGPTGAMDAPKAELQQDFAADAARENPAAELGSEAESLAETGPMLEPAPAPYARTAPNDARASGTADYSAGLTGLRARPEAPVQVRPDTEEFANEAPGSVRITAEDPVSTFSIDIDTASYAVIRSSLMNGTLPPPEAVRIEEMVNYFPYTYPAPQMRDAAFQPSVSVFPTPWNDGTQIVHIGIQGALPALAERPPLNLVFLIDTSGSMQDIDKLPLLKQSFRLMLGQLRPEDRVAIVTYAGSAGQVLEPTPAADSAAILDALDRLDAGGSTAGQAGLQQAYAVAEAMAEDGDVTRVLLATDGDFNVGLSDPDTLKTFIAGKRASGTYLSVLGFGRGNLDDATMQALAQNGNGMAAYIDTLSEAQKVLVDQLSGALFPIADDVKIQVEFNPALVQEYRLIGYETRALRREDFSNDKVDAGDIGAGHSVTAIYEVTPVGSPAALTDPLRYATEAPATDTTGELGHLRLRYKEPGGTVSRLVETPIAAGGDLPAVSADQRFAVAIAGFGQLLRGSDYLGDWGYQDAIALASDAKGEDAFGYRAEAVQLMRLAESLSR